MGSQHNQHNSFDSYHFISGRNKSSSIFLYKGAYIKYVGGGAEGFYKFFKKFFVAQETIELNISWRSSFFR